MHIEMAYHSWAVKGGGSEMDSTGFSAGDGIGMSGTFRSVCNPRDFAESNLQAAFKRERQAH